MKEFVEYLVKNLVDDPEAVKLECFEGERGLVMELRVANDDVGKVVGRQGRTINAVRTLAAIAATRLGHRIRINLIEE